MPILPGMDAETNLSFLLIAVAQGDRAALRAVHERQSVRLFGVANAILRNRDEAADALQDAFLRVAQRAGQFDPERGVATAWLAGIALGPVTGLPATEVIHNVAMR